MASYSSSDLPVDAKERYSKKLQLCGLNCCPYLLPADAWVNDPTQWPDIEWPEIFDFLIESPGIFYERIHEK